MHPLCPRLMPGMVGCCRSCPPLAPPASPLRVPPSARKFAKVNQLAIHPSIDPEAHAAGPEVCACSAHVARGTSYARPALVTAANGVPSFAGRSRAGRGRAAAHPRAAFPRPCALPPADPLRPRAWNEPRPAAREASAPVVLEPLRLSRFFVAAGRDGQNESPGFYPGAPSKFKQTKEKT